MESNLVVLNRLASLLQVYAGAVAIVADGEEAVASLQQEGVCLGVGIAQALFERVRVALRDFFRLLPTIREGPSNDT